MMANPEATPRLVTAEELLEMEDADAYELEDGVLVERWPGYLQGEVATMASPATAPAFVTAEELLEMEDGDAYELVDGVLEERCMGEQSELVTGEMLFRLRNFLRQQRLGKLYASGLGLRIFPDRPGRVPRPDGAYISFARRRTGPPPGGFLTVAPELVFEVVSPRDDATKLETKVGEYLGAGVLLVWVVYPETRTIHVFTPGSEAQRLRAGDILTGGDVLPGFAAPLAEIFAVLDEPAD